MCTSELDQSWPVWPFWILKIYIELRGTMLCPASRAMLQVQYSHLSIGQHRYTAAQVQAGGCVALRGSFARLDHHDSKLPL